MQRSVIIPHVAVMAVLSVSAQQTSKGRENDCWKRRCCQSFRGAVLRTGTKVMLSGPVSMRTESNKDGEYSFVHTARYVHAGSCFSGLGSFADRPSRD